MGELFAVGCWLAGFSSKKLHSPAFSPLVSLATLTSPFITHLV